MLKHVGYSGYYDYTTGFKAFILLFQSLMKHVMLATVKYKAGTSKSCSCVTFQLTFVQPDDVGTIWYESQNRSQLDTTGCKVGSRFVSPVAAGLSVGQVFLIIIAANGLTN